MTQSRRGRVLRAGHWLVCVFVVGVCALQVLRATWQVTFPDGSESALRSWWWMPPLGEAASGVGILQRVLAGSSAWWIVPAAALVVDWCFQAWRGRRKAAKADLG
jgi:hypothetical protein